MSYDDTRMSAGTGDPPAASAPRSLADDLIREGSYEGLRLTDRQATGFRAAAAHAGTPLPDRDDELSRRGACIAGDPDAWFPADDDFGNRNTPARRESAADHAARQCAKCPVQAECLSLALDLGRQGEYGIWGGMSRRDRRVLRPLWVDLRARLSTADAPAGRAA